jgi:hypothetical protein
LPLRGVRVHSDRLKAGLAPVGRRNLGAFVAMHGDRKFNRVTSHDERVLNGFAEGVNFWKCRHNNLKGVLVRFEHHCIAQIHVCRLRPGRGALMP